MSCVFLNFLYVLHAEMHVVWHSVDLALMVWKPNAWSTKPLLHIKIRWSVLLYAVKMVEGDLRYSGPPLQFLHVKRWIITNNLTMTNTFDVHLAVPRPGLASEIYLTCIINACRYVQFVQYGPYGWMSYGFTSLQQYFSHFEMMEGWTWKALCNETPFRFEKNIAPSGIRTRDPVIRSRNR